MCPCHGAPKSSQLLDDVLVLNQERWVYVSEVICGLERSLELLGIRLEDQSRAEKLCSAAEFSLKNRCQLFLKYASEGAYSARKLEVSEKEVNALRRIAIKIFGEGFREWILLAEGGRRCKICKPHEFGNALILREGYLGRHLQRLRACDDAETV